MLVSISAAAVAEFFERIEHVERVVINKTVGTARHGLSVAKESLHIAHRCATANERADASGIEFIHLRVRDISRRGDQSASLIESKRKDVRAVPVPERIARVDVRRVIHAQLMGQSRTVADNVVAGAWARRNVM